jgi:non-ribosomal peptide synthase protein (TIGR01720 family)
MSDLSPEELAGSIAIIGMAGRFPRARNLQEFWHNLRDGVESVDFFSDEELESSGVKAELLKNPNYVKAGTILEGPEMFDAAFFSFSPREADVMDPQQRFFLECAWEALESAGYDPKRYDGAVGVFAGTRMSSYLVNIYTNPELVNLVGSMRIMLANDKDHLPTWVSYKLNLKGPSVNVQTACSTSLVAAHLACQSLLNYQCDMALAGGVSIGGPGKSGYLYEEGGILSPDGHCRAFDAKSHGTVGGSGVGIVVLKRLEEALAEGDEIHAVIRGSAINNDGSLKIGYTAPSVKGQAEVIAMAQAIAGTEAETISYIETHGTGTKLGDPIEVAALTRAFRASTDRSGFCAIGSVKTNIGHADAAAGVAGLLKTVLALKHQQLPPSLHYERPNPDINFAGGPFYVNAKLSRWEANGTPRRAGVSSFGIGGTNAHMILEEAPPVGPNAASRPRQLLLLSARTSSALETTTANLLEHLEQRRGLNLADAAYTLQVGRGEFEYRRALVCSDTDDAIAALEAREPRRVLSAAFDGRERGVVFMFSGQGAQYVNMGRELYEQEPAFRARIDECSDILKPVLGRDLRAALYAEADAAEAATRTLSQTWITQPALFVTEYALAKMWMEWGLKPEAMIGHSIGEYVAACLSGVLTLEHALKLVAARGRLMQSLPAGAMVSVVLAERDVSALLDDELSLAAVNGASRCVVSGTTAAVESFERRLAEREVSFRRLRTSHAFHSVMMEPVLEEFAEQVRSVKLNPPGLPYISNVTGRWITAADTTDPGYWVRHLRGTVRFADGLSELAQEPGRVWLEVGPGNTLATLAKQRAEKSDVSLILSTLDGQHHGGSDGESVLQTMGRLWLAGLSPDWPAFYAQERRRRISLPTYPFERERHWVAMRESFDFGASEKSLERSPDVVDWLYVPSWERDAPLAAEGRRAGTARQDSRWLIFVNGDDLGAQMVERLTQAGEAVVSVVVGEKFAKLGERAYAINPREVSNYERLLGELRERGESARQIVHLWSVAPPTHTPSEAAALDEVLDRGFYSLMHLAQALGEQLLSSALGAEEADDVRITVVTDSAHEVTGDECLSPAQATVNGPVMVIPQEYPGLSCRAVDVVLAGRTAAQVGVLVNHVIREAASGATEKLIAYRGDHRWLQTFKALRPDEVAARPARLREGGVYLITGGLGGVGLELAGYLAQTVRARLVLTGRTALPEREQWDEWLATHDEHDATSRKIDGIRALEHLGADVLALRADVTDPAEMRAAVERARAQFGEIQGVIHAAGTVDGGVIGAKRREVAAAVLAPKVSGAIVLDRLFKDAPLDFLVLCSSMRSLTGGAGMVDYTAANSFLDAFARHRSRAQGAFTVSINWDGWRDVGMSTAASGHQHAQLRTAGEGHSDEGMTAAEAVDAFSRILDGTLPQVIVSTRNIDAVLEQNKKFTAANSLRALEEASVSLPIHSRPHLNNPYVAPGNEIESTLAGIWQKLLGIEQVGVNDNFFELGGDSVVSIQLIAKANQAGLRLTPKQVFEHQTVAELAARAGLAAASPAAQETAAGQLPLTPIQQRFFGQPLSNPHHFNQSILLEVRKTLDPLRLAQVVRHLLGHHDALRLRFNPEATGWRQAYGEVEATAPFSTMDLSALPEAAQSEAIEQRAAETQMSLNLTDGPLLRLVLFNLGAARPGRLLIVVHHLAIDAISWRIVLEDLETAYELLTEGREVQLPAKTTSFQIWAGRLAQYARSEAVRQEFSYWGSEARERVEPLPRDYAGGVNSHDSTDTVNVTLDAEETRALLQEAPAAFRTQINDVLLTALWHAFVKWTGTRALLLEMEGHGREALFTDVDMSRTVGWFTTAFPVLLDVHDTHQPLDGLKSIKEQLRSIPNHGIGYGLLRYLSADAAIAERLRQLPQPEVSFLYLGQLDQALAAASPFSPARESGGPAFDVSERRNYLLEVNGNVSGGQLRMSWIYSKNIHRRATVERLAEEFVRALRTLIEGCRSGRSELYTPSDFPEAGVSQQALDQLVSRMGDFDDNQVEDMHQLSPMQQGMFFHSLYAPESEAYFMQSSYLLSGELNASALRRAWQHVLDRHAAIRTGYLWEGLEAPLAVVRRGVQLVWEEEDWREFSTAEQSARLEAFLRSDRRRGFEFRRAPLMRLTLIAAADDAHHFVLSYHHIVMDGWSAFVVFKEVFAAYERLCQDQEPEVKRPRAYRDYIAWLRQQPLSAAESFWRQALKGFTEPIRLKGEQPPAATNGGGEDFGSQHIGLNVADTTALQSLAHRHRLTLNTLVQGAWGLLLSHQSGREDVVFGSVMSGRPPAIANVDSIVGLFINTLPVRVRVGPEMQLLEWLRELQTQLLELREYEYTPLVEIQRWSEVPRGVPLFESNLSFDNYPVDSSLSGQEDGLKVVDTHSADWSAHPLSVAIGVGAELAVMLKYDRRRFDEAAMAQMARRFQTILGNLAASQSTRLGELFAVLKEADQQEQAVKQKEFKESSLKRLKTLSRDAKTDEHPQRRA